MLCLSAEPATVATRSGTPEDALCLGVLATQVFLDTYATNGIRSDLAREALSVYSQETFAARLADPNSRFERCHFFPFGSLDATLAWGLAVARGDFKLNPDNTDIVL